MLKDLYNRWQLYGCFRSLRRMTTRETQVSHLLLFARYERMCILDRSLDRFEWMESIRLVFKRGQGGIFLLIWRILPGALAAARLVGSGVLPEFGTNATGPVAQCFCRSKGEKVMRCFRRQVRLTPFFCKTKMVGLCWGACVVKGPGARKLTVQRYCRPFQVLRFSLDLPQVGTRHTRNFHTRRSPIWWDGICVLGTIPTAGALVFAQNEQAVLVKTQNS